MRLLLLNTPGATSFAALRTVGNNCFTSFHAAAIDRGLLDNDKIWDETLFEACSTVIDTAKIRFNR